MLCVFWSFAFNLDEVIFCTWADRFLHTWSPVNMKNAIRNLSCSQSKINKLATNNQRIKLTLKVNKSKQTNKLAFFWPNGREALPEWSKTKLVDPVTYPFLPAQSTFVFSFSSLAISIRHVPYCCSSRGIFLDFVGKFTSGCSSLLLEFVKSTWNSSELWNVERSRASIWSMNLVQIQVWIFNDWMVAAHFWFLFLDVGCTHWGKLGGRRKNFVKCEGNFAWKVEQILDIFSVRMGCSLMRRF